MEKKEEKVQEQPKKSKMEELDEEAKKQGKKVSKTWEAAMRLKGSLIVNDEGEQDLGSRHAVERQSDC